ncbi:NAD(+) diphosphatase [Sphingomonas nostoxanthinifaciens]|uniref:NAD(+) diphosphatase n=1 Tax=Sphingomonas nostoxanthinifaciens TaxID=2872652 RepID=UPI001CC20444|nr:NAD(+) diphosphatase [Sphingomonas nostoxanthinifaciens]UAK26167.1 NAD(+) diphosphatase [Sphingomonas nostoxanthinifaciens]
MSGAPGFTGSPLVRLEAPRHDAATLACHVADPRALLLDLAEDHAPIVACGMLGWQPLPSLPPEELVMLGLVDGVPRFAHVAPGSEPARRTPPLMTLLATLPDGEAATYAAARSLIDWHARHRFCAFCGHASHLSRAGWGRLCPNCGTEHFPRTDPVVIMLAQHSVGAAARVLVGRQPSFPPGRYSALAGFVEVGESIEEAVARELGEEAGVVARDVRYLASQPWPFPSQLMIACVAMVDDDALAIDRQELEDARWVGRDAVAAALAGADDAPFLPPPPYAIAHTLFRRWLNEGE